MRVERQIQLLLNQICKVDLKKSKGWEIGRVRKEERCMYIEYIAPFGHMAADIRLDVIEASTGKPVDMIDRGGRAIIQLFYQDFPKQLMFNHPEHIKNDGLLIGYDRALEPFYHPINTHLLAAGASGSGKTDALRWWIYQLIIQGYDIRIADLKGFSFFPFETFCTIAKSMEESEDLLSDTMKELNERKRIVLEHRNREVIKKFKPIVFVVDEGAALSPRQNSGKLKQIATRCDHMISLFGQQGREPRVFMIYCTQRPDMDTINKQYKGNVEAKIAFRTATQINSQIIIDRPGAEKIKANTPGRCIYVSGKEYLLQVPYVGGDDEWNKLLIPLKTEVINGGKSQRKDYERIIVSTDCDNGTNRHDARLQPTVKESVVPVKATGTRRSGGVAKVRHEEGVELIAEVSEVEGIYVSQNNEPSSYTDDF